MLGPRCAKTRKKPAKVPRDGSGIDVVVGAALSGRGGGLGKDGIRAPLLIDNHGRGARRDTGDAQRSQALLELDSVTLGQGGALPAYMGFTGADGALRGDISGAQSGGVVFIRII